MDQALALQFDIQMVWQILLLVMTGVMAGIYYAFSVFVMRAFAKLDGVQGAKAMGMINRVIVQTGFLPLFFVSSFAHLALLFWCLWQGSIWESWPQVSASLMYLAGMFWVTVNGNVPLNNALEQSLASNDATSIHRQWDEYLRKWTRYNHMRTLSCILSAGLLAYGLSGYEAWR